MAVVVVTRTRIARVRHLAPFSRDSVRVALYARRSPGFVTGALRVASGPEFWTMSVWEDGRAMHDFATGGVHAQVAPRMAGWAGHALMCAWQTTDRTLPTWADAQRRLEAAPRFLALDAPSDRHLAKVVPPAPRRSASLPLLAPRATETRTGASRG
jgi:hypothetical protein